jgi:hypothetical protein
VGPAGTVQPGASQEPSPALPLPDRGESAERRTPIDRILVILGLCAFVPVMCLALVGLLLFGLVASADAWQTADYGGQAGRLDPLINIWVTHDGTTVAPGSRSHRSVARVSRPFVFGALARRSRSGFTTLPECESTFPPS